MRFADLCYSNMRKSLTAIPSAVLPYVIVLMREITEKNAAGEYFVPQSNAGRNALKELVRSGRLNYTAFEKGIPLQEFSKTYMEWVDKALEQLAETTAKDPNDIKERNSLRNLAEMQVRYENHQKSISDFKSSGTKLVVCSVHGDCSERCATWQGRVYSLDGTEGYTADGKPYVPLEVATDIYYTTKAGRTYKNGLLGFNCRHKLYSYKEGMIIPTVSKEKQEKEYAVTQTQRKMERAVIQAREKALVNKGVNQKLYKQWRDIARERDAAYRNFSRENNRAYYPERTKIL